MKLLATESEDRARRAAQRAEAARIGQLQLFPVPTKWSRPLTDAEAEYWKAKLRELTSR